MSDEPHTPPSVKVALIPVLALIGALYLSVVALKRFELTTHVSLVLATLVAAVVSVARGRRWEQVEQGMVDGIGLSLRAVLILLMIGMLIGSWIQAGIVPAMIYYGLDLIAPRVFLAATCVICALVSLATGSSWSTVATVGIALIGVGEGLGIPRPQIAGAIISGAYFGDKMSPLSDTTNLAPSVAGSTLFEHIRHMTWTTGPSLALALIGFAVIGYGRSSGADNSQVVAIRQALSHGYQLSPWWLLPPLAIVATVIWRVPALPAICGGWLLGALLALAAQRRHMGEVLAVSFAGVKSKTGLRLVDDLLTRGGLSSMFSPVALILAAMAFGGVMEHGGMLHTLAGAVLGLAKGDGGLILATLLTSLGMNIVASDQYLSVVLPGRMYRPAYEARGLAARNLSRALEDSGTLSSPLIPWNTCGAYMIATLGVRPWSYVPYCLLNLINPVVSAFYGFTGISIAKEPPAEVQNPTKETGGLD